MCYVGTDGICLFVLGVGFILLHSCNFSKLEVGRIVIFQSRFELQLQHAFPLIGFILYSL